MQPKTRLDNRELWWDGVSEVTPSHLESFLLKGVPPSKLSVTELNEEVTRYNRSADVPILPKSSVTAKFPPDWKLPERYKYLDVDEYLAQLVGKIEQDELYEQRLARLAYEVKLYRERNLYAVLRVLIYVLDTFRERGVVWGVGRGSSCSSYLLYLLGLHDVDPVKYDIDVHDFLK